MAESKIYKKQQDEIAALKLLLANTKEKTKKKQKIAATPNSENDAACANTGKEVSAS